MNGKQKYKDDVKPFVLEGILREVFESEGLTVTCFANSTYAIFLHGFIDKTNGLTVGFRLKGKEFAKFMEEPTMENFKWLNYACQQRGENRGFTPTPLLLEKFREVKRLLDRQRNVEVDLALEKQLVDEATRKKSSGKRF